MVEKEEKKWRSIYRGVKQREVNFMGKCHYTLVLIRMKHIIIIVAYIISYHII